MSAVMMLATGMGLETKYIFIGDSIEEITKYIVDWQLKMYSNRMICELCKQREIRDKETNAPMRHSVSIYDKRIEFSRVHYEHAAELVKENNEELNKHKKEVKLTTITPKVINEWCKDQISNKEIGYIYDRYFVTYNKETGNFTRFCIRKNRAFVNGEYNDKIVLELTTLYSTGFG